MNRGPDSRGVLDIAVALSKRYSTVFIAGNHDRALLRYLKKGDFVRFAMMGGLATIRSYVGVARDDVHAQLLSVVPPDHTALLASLVSHWETPHILITHAGVPPDKAATRSPLILADGSFPELFAGAWREPKLLVCGHYAQASHRPFCRDNFVCLDSGCGSNGGPLSALLLPEFEFVSSA